MALFSLIVQCGELGRYITQVRSSSPKAAIRAFLKDGSLDAFLTSHPDWPKGFKVRDIYAFLPLEGLPNVYFCGLGQRGKYVEIHLVHTARRSNTSGARVPTFAVSRHDAQ
ncbi:MAG: hypothetical protein IPJ21_20110 [Sterolibacteriaceae bacterium]|nr:hypothetical protein [Sterolibacteriaceae bacterium]